MTETDHYAIRGIEGRERLALLSSIFAGSTARLLDMAGVAEGACCLDAGCGGDVSLELARRAGPTGRVIGIDLDEAKLEIARREAEAAGAAVAYHALDIADALPGPFDMVYMRFLLSHLAEPAAALANAAAALSPGGLIVVEDVDFEAISPIRKAPHSRATPTSIPRWCAAEAATPISARAFLNCWRMPAFPEIQVNVLNPAATSGRLKLLTPVTMEAISAAAVTDGAATGIEVNRLIDTLYEEARDPSRLISLPRIVQCWARKPEPC